MKYACVLASSFWLAACATANSGFGGGGGAGSEAAGGADGTGGSSDPPQGGGGDTVACKQDCSTIEVPLCFLAECNSATGNCDIRAAEEGAECEDGFFCTTDDRCVEGKCEAGGPQSCTEDDADACLASACDEALDSCAAVPAPNGTACVSDNPCLSNTLCVNGQCQGAPRDCSATPVTNTDCQSAKCDPATGLCGVVSVNDGIACTMGDICESGKTCAGGACEGAPINNCTGCTEAEPNGTFSTANSGANCGYWAGGIGTFTDVDCFRVAVTVAGSNITAEVVDAGGVSNTCPPNFDSVLRLLSPIGTQLATDDDGGLGVCSKLIPTTLGTTNLPVGAYSVCVESLDNELSPPYVLILSATAPGCGDEILQVGEACDGTMLDGSSCALQGFAGGTLACDASCAFDVSGCVQPGCGNGLPEVGEACDDGNLLDGDSCSSTCTPTVYECAPGQTAVTIPATGLPIPIEDFDEAVSALNVPSTGTVAKAVIELNIAHTFDADLVISIDPPGATPVVLAEFAGGSGADFVNTVVTLGGFPPIQDGEAPFTGFFGPFGNLAAVLGTAANGPWVLTVEDGVSGDTGSLNGWTLHLCVQP